ncbi:MAG: hotdog fold thioesterase [Bacteroidales bacterium]|nr:hotdog fold thioesterase [Bacteroidales bacterium]
MTIEELNKFCENTLIDHLEIKFLEYGDFFISAKMPVNSKKHQPYGILHGGASLALAETVASAGSVLLMNDPEYDVFGYHVSGNHVSTVKDGTVWARAELLHKGITSHLWDVTITDDQKNTVSLCRVTIRVLRRKEEQN